MERTMTFPWWHVDESKAASSTFPRREVDYKYTGCYFPPLHGPCGTTELIISEHSMSSRQSVQGYGKGVSRYGFYLRLLYAT